jgi:hypothetical protein
VPVEEPSTASRTAVLGEVNQYTGCNWGMRNMQAQITKIEKKK